MVLVLRDASAVKALPHVRCSKVRTRSTEGQEAGHGRLKITLPNLNTTEPNTLYPTTIILVAGSATVI